MNDLSSRFPAVSLQREELNDRDGERQREEKLEAVKLEAKAMEKQLESLQEDLEVKYMSSTACCVCVWIVEPFPTQARRDSEQHRLEELAQSEEQRENLERELASLQDNLKVMDDI